MDINLTFIENRAIRVVVLPIGDISNESYKEYSSLIRTLGIIELSGITRDANESKILEKISWVDGHMLLNFIDSSVDAKDEWDDFNIHKKIFGVIGVVDCKRSKDLQDTKKQFEDAVARYPSAVATVCYAFDPLEDQQDLERGKFVMIPNVGDKKHLLFYLSTLLFDFSHTLLKHFEKMVSEVDNNQKDVITTPLEISRSWDELSRLKKRKPGRLAKCKADYCLLAGSPLDAIKFYDLSIELTKSNNDWEWIAGSYEGYISAVLSKRNQEYHSQSQNNLSPSATTHHHIHHHTPSLLGVGGSGSPFGGTVDPAVAEDQQIRDMVSEALQCYNKRKTLSFEIDLTIKMANYHASLDKRTEASELLTQAFDLAFDLPLNERIIIVCSIALAYYAMGFKRKFAFYIREAAFLYNRKPENWEKISHLFIICSKFMQLEDLFGDGPTKFLEERNKTYSYTVSTASNTKKQQSASRSKQATANLTTGGNAHRFQTRMPQLSTSRRKEGWYTIQQYLLRNLISVASSMQDSVSISKYIIYILRTQYKQLTQQQQTNYQSDLAHHSKTLSTSINTNVHMNILGFPFLVRVVPLPLADHLQPISRQINTSSQKDKFFIYSPYEQKNNQSNEKKKQNLWVEGECNVLVTLCNPFGFEVLVQGITLSTAGVPFESYPLSFKVLANTDKFDIIVSGRTLRPGPLIIKGVFIRSYNLLSEHPIDPQGNAISINQYQQLVKRDAYKFDPESPVQPASLADDINKIQVIADLPLLDVSVPSYGAVLSLFAGELNTFTIMLENIGNQPIESIDIQLQSLDKSVLRAIAKKHSNTKFDDEDDSDDPVFTWEQSMIDRNLPLPPGASFLLPIKVFVRPKLAGNQMVIMYSRTGEEHLYQRKVVVPLQLDINFGPEVTNFDILYTSKKSLLSLEPYILMNSNGSNTPISKPAHLPNIQNDYSLLMFEIKNNSSTHSFDIIYNLIKKSNDITFDNTKYSLAPNSTINIIVPMKREPFPDNLPQIRQAKGQYIKPKKKLTEHEEYLNRLIQYYKDSFLKNINLHWISSDNTKGNVLLNGINLTPKMVYKLASDPIIVEFKDHSLSKRYEAGSLQTIEIVVTNVLNTNISGLILHIQPTLDQELENKTLNINKKLGYIGSLTIPIKELEAHKSYQHNFQVIFFEKESYRFIISCEIFQTKQIVPSPHSLKVQVI